MKYDMPKSTTIPIIPDIASSDTVTRIKAWPLLADLRLFIVGPLELDSFGGSRRQIKRLESHSRPGPRPEHRDCRTERIAGRDRHIHSRQIGIRGRPRRRVRQAIL